ncbi:hypothetical protein BU26DRAFT_499773 [Trematosphaeria pertusa]|uniref:Uncharacterized protein n=1 Tax=Trematosphaeria pertusa TaxID=390896 RepID=A0A6A6J3M8_9PLEO|nr:uncharacterized protein BU26DRAFT_499773 [Trematosphaeria pertusa]KAF2257246.1 hypothetical protein BU26DRAFT_499773 [Trematosphaeria pertusa]
MSTGTCDRNPPVGHAQNFAAADPIVGQEYFEIRLSRSNSDAFPNRSDAADAVSIGSCGNRASLTSWNEPGSWMGGKAFGSREPVSRFSSALTAWRMPEVGAQVAASDHVVPTPISTRMTLSIQASQDLKLACCKQDRTSREESGEASNA